MLMLNGESFATGRALYRDHRLEGAALEAKIFVKFRPAGLDQPLVAAIDTGAVWSCLAPEVAEELGLDRALGERTSISTRWGVVDGSLVRMLLTLLADDGDSLDVEATVFVPSGHPYPPDRTFLGYGGLLDRIRFAFDPQRNHFYFGEAPP